MTLRTQGDSIFCAHKIVKHLRNPHDIFFPEIKVMMMMKKLGAEAMILTKMKQNKAHSNPNDWRPPL